MELQQIYEKIRAHFLTQGQKATNNGFCVYRGPNNIKCAVGCLITDEAYDTALENNSVSAKNVQEALSKSGIIMNADTYAFLSDAQSVHDTAYDTPNALIAEVPQLDAMAKRLGLKVVTQ